MYTNVGFLLFVPPKYEYVLILEKKVCTQFCLPTSNHFLTVSRIPEMGVTQLGRLILDVPPYAKDSKVYEFDEDFAIIQSLHAMEKLAFNKILVIPENKLNVLVPCRINRRTEDEIVI